MTEKKRIRKFFGKNKNIIDIPNILDIQKNSYNSFLQFNIPIKYRKNIGLQNILNSNFPISSKNKFFSFNFISYDLIFPKNNIESFIKKKLTYSLSLIVKFKLKFFNKNKKQKKIKIEKIHLANIPIMSNTASFIINGIEKVVISQLYRSPGVYFEYIKGKDISGKLLYSAKIIPYIGSWLEFEFDKKNHLFFRIDKTKKLPITILFKAMGLKLNKILNNFYKIDKFILKKDIIKMKIIYKNLLGKKLPFNITKLSNRILIKKNKKINFKNLKKLNTFKYIKVPENYLLNKIISKDIINKENKLIIFANTIITEKIILKLKKNNINCIKTLCINELSKDNYILNTLKLDNTLNEHEACVKIYKLIKFNQNDSKEFIDLFVKNLFYDKNKYNLSNIGRKKFNKKINNFKNHSLNLTNKDILSFTKAFINLKYNNNKIDDIDNLNNKRIRSVGEFLENQFRFGLSRVIKIINDRINKSNVINFNFKDLINFNIISYLINNFFNLSPFCQFMDQINLLSDMTHKRRISSLGPGGLKKENASFEIRDVHFTHYGRLCPIETPEGPNIGLINSFTLYSNINKNCFIETPYIKVKNGILTNKIKYLSSKKEKNLIIAQANTIIDKFGKILNKEVYVRKNGEIFKTNSLNVHYIDISCNQTISLAASLIPFLEHNDANRALMGSNMQRQAVPCIQTEKPLIGTGMERIIANDSGYLINAINSGIVDYVDSKKIIIIPNNNIFNKNNSKFKINFDIYYLKKYKRSNQNTIINHKPIVNVGDFIKKNDIIADNSSTDLGELSLGNNILIAFMLWDGYNFEDSIIVSERLVSKDIFTSIHLEELSLSVKDTIIGPEKITRDTKYLSKYKIFNLNKFGIIKIGSKVKPGDILIGKITPKIEMLISPEEKLLRSIFNIKSSLPYKDTSFKVPSNLEGTVIDVQIVSVKDKELDSYLNKKVNFKLKKFYLNFSDIMYKIKKNIFKYLKEILIGQYIKIKNIKLKLTKKVLFKIKKKKWLNLKINNKKIIKILKSIKLILKKQKKMFKKMFEKKKKELLDNIELSPDILKEIKIVIAMKRKLQPGDKMSGRHGNKGVVSCIMPIEDMPYMADGTPIDIILNPLSIPSRMNAGQVFEIHLGLASKGLGDRIKEILNSKPININNIKKFLFKIYNIFGQKEKLNLLSNNEILELAQNLTKGIPFSSPVFNGAKEKEIFYMLNLAYPDNISKKLKMNKFKNQIKLYDGRTGKAFNRFITIGYMYFLKLNHLVDDKMHARSTGPYSLITQQPLKGKAKIGGQRLGEMEVWALEAYGAAFTLREMLTIKSDDIKGRTSAYENLVQGSYNIKQDLPESFNLLFRELRSLCIDVKLKK